MFWPHTTHICSFTYSRSQLSLDSEILSKSPSGPLRRHFCVGVQKHFWPFSLKRNSSTYFLVSFPWWQERRDWKNKIYFFFRFLLRKRRWTRIRKPSAITLMLGQCGSRRQFSSYLTWHTGSHTSMSTSILPSLTSLFRTGPSPMVDHDLPKYLLKLRIDSMMHAARTLCPHREDIMENWNSHQN